MGLNTMKGDALTARCCCIVRRNKGDLDFYRIMEVLAGQQHEHTLTVVSQSQGSVHVEGKTYIKTQRKGVVFPPDF